MNRSLFGTILVLVICPDPSEAQTTADTLSVTHEAVVGAIGEMPLEHPGGETNRVCFYGSPYMGEPVVSAGVLSALVEGLKKSGVAEAEGCYNDDEEWMGGWTRNEAGELAVILRLLSVEFPESDLARIRVETMRGGRWGKRDECEASAGEDGRWKLLGCKVVRRF